LTRIEEVFGKEPMLIGNLQAGEVEEHNAVDGKRAWASKSSSCKVRNKGVKRCITKENGRAQTFLC